MNPRRLDECVSGSGVLNERFVLSEILTGF
jgi:hypothetical protein